MQLRLYIHRRRAMVKVFADSAVLIGTSHFRPEVEDYACAVKVAETGGRSALIRVLHVVSRRSSVAADQSWPSWPCRGSLVKPRSDPTRPDTTRPDPILTRGLSQVSQNESLVTRSVSDC